MSRSILVGLSVLVLAGCQKPTEPAEPAAATAEPAAATAPAATPASSDAAALAAYFSKAELCVHFGGEFNGDLSERDREVNTAMADAGCDTLDAETATMRARYAGDAAILKRIDDTVGAVGI